MCPEGLALRALGIEKDALILGNPLPHAVPDAVNAHLTLTAGRLGLLPALAAAAEAAQTEVKIQIKIDTGLHRVGVTPGDELEALLKELSAAGERIKLAGVYSHFADTGKAGALPRAGRASAAQRRAGRARGLCGADAPYLRQCRERALPRIPL